MWLVDVLSLLFSIKIMLFHFARITGTEYGVFDFRHGSKGLEFFFLVSGYLFAKNCIEKNDSVLPFDYVLLKYKAFFLPVLICCVTRFSLQHIYSNMKVILSDGLNSILHVLLLRNYGFNGYEIIDSTWYISAMIICFFIIYPILKKYKLSYIFYIAPLVALALEGWMDYTYGNVGNYARWTGLFYKSSLRAFAEINLGVFLYGITERLKKVEFTRFGNATKNVLAVLSIVISLFYMAGVGGDRDSLMILFLALGITGAVTLNEQWGISDKGNKACAFLKKLSLYLFLVHEMVLRDIMSLFCEGEKPLLGTFLVLSLIVALLVVFCINNPNQIVATNKESNDCTIVLRV